MLAPREPDRIGQTALGDGRRLGWAEWGPQDGAPVVLCHGAALGRSLGFGDPGEHGVRLIAVDRPGLGASDASPRRTLLDWPRDVAALGLERPHVVGYSQGTPFALACGAAGVASAVTIVAGTDELAHPAFADALDPHLRGMVDAATEDPAGVEASMAAMTGETFHAMTLRFSGDADRAVYEEPDFAAALRRAIEEGFAQGPAGYARDTALAMAPWPFRLEELEVPTRLWYGALDESPVHSPDHGATLERRIPGARRHLVEDGGGALLWTHADEILRSLAP